MKTPSTTDLSIYGTGAVVTALGFTVMLAWYTGHHDILQIHKDFVPMAFNTAFCLLLCGLGILTARGKFNLISLIAVTLVAFFAFVVGLQYFTGTDIGIDRVFFQQELQVRTSHPGRMAPNTVFYFLLTSSSLISWHIIQKPTTRITVLTIMGIIILLLSLIALIGYVIKLESAYSWWGMSDMAPLTAFGFLLLSIGILGIANSEKTDESQKQTRFLKPILAASIGITITLLVNQGLLIRDRNHIERLASEQSSKAAHIIDIEIENDILALGRMQDRLIAMEQLSLVEWKKDAINYVNDNPAYKSLALIGSDHKIIDEVFRYKDIDLWPNILSRLPSHYALWKEKERMSVTKFSPFPGKTLIIFLFPITSGDTIRAYLAAAYDIQEEISNLPDAGHGLQSYIEILDDTETIYSNKTGEKFIWQYSHKEKINFYGQEWTVIETMNIARPTNPGLVILVFFAGVGFSLMLAKAIWQTHKIREYTNILQERDERYTRAVNAAQVGLWDWNVPDETLIWAGSAWEILGAQDNQSLSKVTAPIFDLINENDREETERKIREGVVSEHRFNVEYRTKRLDGQEIWVQSRGKVVEFKDGKPIRVSGTLMDITRRKINEAELTRSNQELERFAYVASHDLKAPLRSIDNLAKWVIEDTDGILAPDAREKLELLRGRVARLEALLEDILAYSRVGRIVDEPAEVDVQDLVNSLIQSHVREGFKADISGHLPTIVSPRTPLEQIFGNLLTNACKHHDKDTGIISIRSYDRGYFCEFVVADDGPGIPPQFHDRVFEMFQTLQPRDKVDGSGIGMSIIKKLVEWRGGKVWIVSGPGLKGTEIHFTWPKK